MKAGLKNSSASSTTSTNTISSEEIKQVIDNLRGECIRSTTKRNYYSVWKQFNQFFIQLDVKPNNWEDRLTLFVGYLISYRQAQSQTIRSYVSAIKTILLIGTGV